MLTQLFFGYCALMIIMSGILAISLRSPVHCVLMVLVMFLHIAGLYLTLNAEFLAAVQIIVYAGAVLVLYLFVLFLVNLRDEIRLNPFVGNVWVGRGIAIGLALALIAVLPAFIPGEKGEWPLAAVREVTHTKAMGLELYTTYLFPFEIAGLILLVAVIGGLVLARREQGQPPDHEEDEVAPSASHQLDSNKEVR